ncbi:MAG: 3-oxoacyl-ACP reductase family protein [Thermoanaerobaculia bacterium]
MTTPEVHELLDLSAKTAVVTGAGRGIGTAIARRLAEAGADVAIGYRTSGAQAEALAATIAEGGRRAIAVQADVTREDDVERLIARTEDELGGLDILINNAGIYPLAALTEMSVDDWETTIDANLKSVFLATRAAARRMIVRGGGAIVNIASIEAANPAPMHSHYNAAKAGVVMHTRAAAAELGGHGIRVNAVSPGLIWRPGIEEQWPEGVERYTHTAPLGRLGRPEDVADACLFLASAAARWITGAELRVDGGVMTAQIF